MKNLLIIGARGFGREVYELATDCIEAGADFYVKGFLDVLAKGLGRAREEAYKSIFDNRKKTD